jgi:hypothetical protein
MKLKTILSILTLTLILALSALAQDAQPDHVKVSAAFTGTEISSIARQGFSGEIDGRLIRAGRFRVGGVFQFARTCSDCRPRADIFSAGPQVSADIFNGRVSLFGRALFGLTTDYKGNNSFTRTYGGGFDVNLGHLFIRPLAVDWRRVEGVPVTVHQYSVGAGFRF